MGRMIFCKQEETERDGLKMCHEQVPNTMNRNIACCKYEQIIIMLTIMITGKMDRKIKGRRRRGIKRIKMYYVHVLLPKRNVNFMY